MMYLDQRSPTVRTFMQAHGMRDPQDAIVDCAIELLEEVGIDKPPVDLRIVASYQRVKSIQKVAMKHAGRLIPVGPDYIIQVNKNDIVSRQNFTIAHEIGHTLLWSNQAMPPMLEDRATGYFPQKQEEEHLCDLAASELLMPRFLLWPLIGGRELSIDLVAELSWVFGSSHQATAIRLMHTGLWSSAFVVWKQWYWWTLSPGYGIKWRSSPSSVKNLGIKYVFYSPSFDRVLPGNLEVQSGGCLERCLRKGGVVCGEERFNLGQESVTYYVMAAAVDFRDRYGVPVREIFSLFLSNIRDKQSASSQ